MWAKTEAQINKDKIKPHATTKYPNFNQAAIQQSIDNHRTVGGGGGGGERGRVYRRFRALHLLYGGWAAHMGTRLSIDLEVWPRVTPFKSL